MKYSLEYLSSEESTVLPQLPATPGQPQMRKINWIVEALEDGQPKTISEIKATMLENLRGALSLHFFQYNFGRIHRTLKCTPAMVAGLAGSIWTVDRLLPVWVACPW